MGKGEAKGVPLACETLKFLKKTSPCFSVGDRRKRPVKLSPDFVKILHPSGFTEKHQYALCKPSQVSNVNVLTASKLALNSFLNRVFLGAFYSTHR